ncbi:MAG TPA: hypothetical protein DDW50_21065 [Firmicutes bacterium]|jgi:hypothetical protein|nr:hypothetical protein [Bacillota bacterium]
MEYEDISKITERIAVGDFKDKNGHSLESNIWYMELKDVISRHKKERKIYKETIGLLNSMVLSGEKHGEKSQAMVERALRMVPSNEQIWEKAVELMSVEYANRVGATIDSPEDMKYLIRANKLTYFVRATTALESGN